MNLVVKASPSNTEHKVTYDVLIETQKDGQFKATLLGLPDCQALGNTEAEAVETLIQSLQIRLENAKILTLEVESKELQHPWLKFSGMHKDNPLFDEVIAYIEEERNAIDSQMEEIHAEFINEIDQELEKTGVNNSDEIMKMFYLKQRNQVFNKNDMENNL